MGTGDRHAQAARDDRGVRDPKYYTRPWVALDRLSYRLQAPGFDIPEQECVPSETAKHNELFANPAAGVGDTAK
jgi:hypothetical protein